VSANAKKLEQALIWGACLVAAIRVFVYAAAFPFFNNVDEQAHFDLVLRYARHGVRPGMEHFSDEAAEYIALYSSTEYILGPTNFPGAKAPPPVWMMAPERAAYRFEGIDTLWRTRTNHEGTSPPLYYFVAAQWWRMGEALGLEGGYLLYWIRFLNVIFGGVLVWLGYWAASLVFPEPRFPRPAVALLLAFFPQDIFYSIQSDVLSPILFGLAFIGLIKLWQSENPGIGLTALTGAAIAGTALVKATNFPLTAIAAAAVLARVWELARAGKLRAISRAFGILAVSALLPIAAWMWFSYHAFGDVSGAAQKIRLMGWARKPLNQWWPHPLFTWQGERVFIGEMLASFWRGEFCWDSRRLASPIADAFYCWSSFTLVGAAFLGRSRFGRGLSRDQCVALWIALAACAASLAFVAISSLAFDFGAWEYPSKGNPVLTSGRLMIGALIPFLLLYVYGLSQLLGWRGNRWAAPMGLAAILVLITVSEIVVNRPAFASSYNFFHLVPLEKAVADVPAVYLRPRNTR
jgi:hypothetical protein